ncbi:MAG: terminase [Prevotellaceae bacterium]|nr:terminase [Prevotellaceae bacterium]
MATKLEIGHKKELARLYYMEGQTQQYIAEKIDVSRTTMVNWVKNGDWEKKRALKSLSRRELVNELLSAVSTMIELVKECAAETRKTDPMKAMEILMELPKKMYGFADQIHKLDKKDNVLEMIEYFNGFNSWLEIQSLSDKRLTREILTLINEYQDSYIDKMTLNNINI